MSKIGKFLKGHPTLSVSVLILVLLFEAITTGLIPSARGYLFDILNSHSNMIWFALGVYFVNLLSIEFAQSVKAFVVRKVSLLYRKARTVSLPEISPEVMNIPQRIQEDIKFSYHNRITVWCEYFVSGIILVQLVIMNLGQPVLVGAALIYSVISVIIATRFNPRLTRAEIEVQQEEANFREDLTARMSDFSRLDLVNTTVLRAEKIRLHYYLFTRFQGSLLSILPFIVLIPSFFANTITLGVLMNYSSAFALIVVNATILLSLYPTLIQGLASEQRVKELSK